MAQVKNPAGWDGERTGKQGHPRVSSGPLYLLHRPPSSPAHTEQLVLLRSPHVTSLPLTPPLVSFLLAQEGWIPPSRGLSLPFPYCLGQPPRQAQLPSEQLTEPLLQAPEDEFPSDETKAGAYTP